MTNRTFRWGSTFSVAFAMLVVGNVFGQNQAPPATSIINEELSKSWKAAELRPSKRSTDYEFVRRAFIDIIGRIPSAEEARDFADLDRTPNKRAKLVHRLLYARDYNPKDSRGRPMMDPANPKQKMTYDYASEYARHWSNIWTVWLMTRGGVAEEYHDSMELYLESEFVKNTPWNELVRALVTAKGKTNDNGAAAFVMAHLGERTPQDRRMEDGPWDAVPITSRVTRLFLGIQTNCIQCHDHPFSPELKQEHFWQVNAFFRTTDIDRMPANRNGNNNKKMAALPVEVKDDPEYNRSQRIFMERRSGVIFAVKPNFLPNMAELMEDAGAPKRTVPAGKSRRDALADYLLQHDNFGKAFVNRMWGHFFGRGMNELAAADDFGGHNQVVHVDLLTKLGHTFSVEYYYDIKKMIETICNSDAYSLSYQANGLPEGKGGNATLEAEPYFTRMPLKSMSPEVLFESLEVATRLGEAADKDARRAKRTTWMNKLVANFGDDEGNEVTFNGTIVQALLMMNGPELNSEISRKNNSTVERAMAMYPGRGTAYDEASIVNELFMTALARKPSTVIKVEIPRVNPRTNEVMKDSKGEVLTTQITEDMFIKQQILAVRQKATGGNAKQVYQEFFEDLFWSLLNSSEFILNH